MELFYILIIGIYNYAIYFVSFPLIESPFKLFSITILHFVFVTFLTGLYSKLFLSALPIEIPKLFLCLYLSIIPVIFVWSNLQSQKVINRINNFKGDKVVDSDKKKNLYIVFTAMVSLVQLLILFTFE
jgi:hypothetical protein